jgi:sugar/nucleoside kinase (ribokinase family)
MAGPGPVARRGALWVLGNLTIDDVVLPDGTTAMGLCGGNAVYAALGAAIWRRDVALSVRIGPDFPRAHMNQIERAGIEVALVEVTTPSIHQWALYEPDDVRRFVTWVSSGTHADQSIRPDELPAGMAGAGACHVAPMPLTIQAALLRRLKRRRPELLSLDPHDEYIAGHEAELLALLQDVDIFMPSRKEARLVHGRDDPEQAARAFVRAGAGIVAIKLGPDGSIVCGTDGVAHQVPAVPAAVVETTGAGDAYCGGFLAAYRNRPDAVEAACHGAVSASFAVERRGAVALVDIEPKEAQRRLAWALDAASPNTPRAAHQASSPAPPSAASGPASILTPPGTETRRAHG